jgi:bacterial/archaeal transporter family-2 protein
MNILSYVAAFLAGAGSPIQAGASAQLNKGLASPVWAALFVYVSGLLGVMIMQLVVRTPFPLAQMRGGEIPWWAWSGGLLSIGLTVTGLTLAQKLGSGLYTGLTLTASLLTSIALDHFGLAGFKPHPVTPLRGAGAGLLVAGIWLIARF